MSDFEDVFGAGADFDAIIDNIDRWNREEEERHQPEPYPSGRSITRAKSCYEVTGASYSLPKSALAEIDQPKRELFEKEASVLAEAIDTAYGSCVEWEPRHEYSGFS